MRRPGDQRVVVEAWIEAGVEDDEGAGLRNGVRAERDFTVRLA